MISVILERSCLIFQVCVLNIGAFLPYISGMCSEYWSVPALYFRYVFSTRVCGPWAARPCRLSEATHWRYRKSPPLPRLATTTCCKTASVCITSRSRTTRVARRRTGMVEVEGARAGQIRGVVPLPETKICTVRSVSWGAPSAQPRPCGLRARSPRCGT